MKQRKLKMNVSSEIETLNKIIDYVNGRLPQDIIHKCSVHRDHYSYNSGSYINVDISNNKDSSRNLEIHISAGTTVFIKVVEVVRFWGDFSPQDKKKTTELSCLEIKKVYDGKLTWAQSDRKLYSESAKFIVKAITDQLGTNAERFIGGL